MTAFSCKKLQTPPRFCLCLKQARTTRGISLGALARETHVKASYLQAIEECRPHDIPAAPVYIKQYVRAYAEAVGLGAAARDLLASFDIEDQRHTMESHTKKTPPRARYGLTAFLNLPRLARGLAVCAVLALFGIGIGMQWLRFVKPPELTIINPPDGFMTTLPAIVLHGVTEKEVAVNINGAPVQHNENGSFEAPIHLETGVNTFAVQATKKSGKQTTLIRTIIREDARERLSLRSPAGLPN